MTTPLLRMTAFDARPCTPGLTGTASFEVTFEVTFDDDGGGSITRDLRTAWHHDPTNGLTVQGISGGAMAWFGGNLSLTGRVYAAILDALGVTDEGTPTT